MLKYSSYKNSSYDWLGQIPAHWKEKFLEQTASEKCVKNIGGTVKQVLSLSYGKIKKKSDLNKGLIAQDLSTYQIIEPDDIIMRFTDLQNDHKSLRTGLVNDNGIITAAYLCLVPRMNSGYLHYLLHAYDVQKVFYGMGGGVRQSIGFKDIRHMYIPVPPRAEQDQIVWFLDWKVSEINKLIGIRKKEIQELEELRESTILHTTTSGLDTSVPMKRTDNFWIGTIPEHWNVVQVRRVYSVILGKMLATKPAYSSDTYEEYVCAKDVHFDGVDLSDLKQMWFSTSEKQQYKIEANDLLIVEGGAGAGNAALVKEPLDRDIYVQNSIHIVRPKSNRVTTNFLAYWMRSMVKRDYMKYVCNVATLPHYTKDKVMSTVMPLPSENEQKEIVRYLDNECEKINNLITKRHSQIATLQELKNSLISDAVAGKIDVRNVTIPEYEHVDDIVDDDSENDEETETDGEEA